MQIHPVDFDLTDDDSFKQLVSLCVLLSEREPIIVRICNVLNTYYLAHSDVIAFMVNIHNYGPKEMIGYMEQRINKCQQKQIDRESTDSKNQVISLLQLMHSESMSYSFECQETMLKHHYDVSNHSDELPEIKETFVTLLSEGYNLGGIFIKKALISGSHRDDILHISDLIYEQQMLAFLSHLDLAPGLHFNEVFVLHEDGVADYYGLRPEMRVLSDSNDENEVTRGLCLLVNYLTDLHVNKKLFHGDIKPANLFIDLHGAAYMETDCTSVMPLYCTDPDKPYYMI